MNQKNLNNSVITKKDLIGVFFRSFPIDWSWNYIKQQNLGYAYAMIPILNKVYKKKKTVLMHISGILNFLILHLGFPPYL